MAAWQQSSLLAFPPQTMLVCHHATSLKSRDWFLRLFMRLVAGKTASFENRRVNWRPLQMDKVVAKRSAAR